MYRFKSLGQIACFLGQIQFVPSILSLSFKHVCIFAPKFQTCLYFPSYNNIYLPVRHKSHKQPKKQKPRKNPG
jgi:hypothetical protein